MVQATWVLAGATVVLAVSALIAISAWIRQRRKDAFDKRAKRFAIEHIVTALVVITVVSVLTNHLQKPKE